MKLFSKIKNVDDNGIYVLGFYEVEDKDEYDEGSDGEDEKDEPDLDLVWKMLDVQGYFGKRTRLHNGKNR